jgi:hypothetical protein
MEVVAPEEIPVTFEGMSSAEAAYRFQGDEIHWSCANR